MAEKIFKIFLLVVMPALIIMPYLKCKSSDTKPVVVAVDTVTTFYHADSTLRPQLDTLYFPDSLNTDNY